MTGGRMPVVAAALVIAAPTAGCGLGPGESSEGEAILTVTRDYGAEPMLEAIEPEPRESETVIRFLDREAEITTRFGGGFVQSIDGVEGAVEDGRSLDWFFFVNGIESATGAAEVDVRGDDRIWWDYRDWSDALRTPAVVGSWPEPFAQASAGDERLPVRVECSGRRAPCERVAERLDEEGVEASVGSGPAAAAAAPALRLLVGPWPAIRADPVAAQLDDGPQASGVFARFERSGSGYRLVTLDERARTVFADGSGAGLVAGLRRGDDPPVWLVTGTDAAGVREAATTLNTWTLANVYALYASAEVDLPLPTEGPG